MNHLTIYTDGACKGNPGPGGWGALLKWKDKSKAISGFESHTSNNRMEMMAAIQAMMLLKKSCYIKLYTDSQYLKKGISEWVITWQKKNWKTSAGKPVKNMDLWLILLEQSAKHKIEWHWVKGHNNDPDNDYVDALANKAIKEQMGTENT